MYWTFQLATQLDDAPWPASKEQLIDYAERSGLSLAVIENLRELEDECEEYDSIVEIWPEYPDWNGTEYFGDDDEAI